ncbi:MAG: putative toxin-antitoxin system toxin component, PIN family [candidate division Zixibacteria bacterium]|nr:putative toxin-antitoxin system toxin component, PIN family [candidate division Zixibacteria bacterium]
MIKAVLDANVLVSAMLTPKGHPAEILRKWRAGSLDLVISLSLLREIQRVISYPKIKKRLAQSDSEVNEFLLGLAQFSIMVYGEPQIDIIKEDPTDNKYLACAQKAEADFIVTGDQHLLKLQNHKGTKIVNPKEFLNILKEA